MQWTNGRFYWNRDHLWDGTTEHQQYLSTDPGLAHVSRRPLDSRTHAGPDGWTGLIRSLQFSHRLMHAHSTCRSTGFVSTSTHRSAARSHGQAFPARSTCMSIPTVSPMAMRRCWRRTRPATPRRSVAQRPAPDTPFSRERLRPAVIRCSPVRQDRQGLSPIVDRLSVNAAPTLTVTSPSEEGSADDFATTQLGNPWDMNATSDVETYFNVTSPTITMLPTETPGGVSLGITSVLYGTSTQAGAACRRSDHADRVAAWNR